MRTVLQLRPLASLPCIACPLRAGRNGPPKMLEKCSESCLHLLSRGSRTFALLWTAVALSRRSCHGRVVVYTADSIFSLPPPLPITKTT